jgi:chromosome segregation protein
MEIADALYGVSMRGDGISQVISQRLRTRGDEPAKAAEEPAEAAAEAEPETAEA